MHSEELTADYIIVGGGSAGCVLANRLSENPRNSVLLLEAGGEDWNPLIHIPAGYIKTMVNPAVNWMFETEPEPDTGNRPIAFPRGKVLGGSSAINAMLYVRGQARDYDRWADAGNAGWSAADVLPYFKKAENCQVDAILDGPTAAHHGTDGPLVVNRVQSTYPVLDRLMSAAAGLGYPTTSDYNGPDQEGLGYSQVTQKNGLRFSAKRAYLSPARRRPNLRVITHAMVTELTFSDPAKVDGVRFTRRGKNMTAKAGREVILAAGAIQSPQILELSGVGQPDRLSGFGIDVKKALTGVGENLADHYISRLSWRLNAPLSLNANARGMGLVREVLRFVLTRKGTLTMPAAIVLGFVKSSPDLPVPDIQYHIANASFSDPAKRIFHDFPGLTIGPCQLRPKSRGTVHITSGDPLRAPAISPNFLAHEEDQRIHVAGMKIARAIMQSDEMSAVVDHELTPGAEAASDEALLDYARATGVTLYHPVSTCRMGPDPARGDVVDASLRVHGVAGLRVVDASIMPELVSGNTNAPVIMIAEKAADIIRSDAAG